MPLDALIAFAALTMPPNSATTLPPCRPETIRAVAVAMEIMDAREAKWYFRSPGEYATDLNTMRERHRELVDAPRLVDASRFPPDAVCYAMRSSNESYSRWLEGRIGLDSSEDWIEDAITECKGLRAAWEAALDAQHGYYYVSVRRKALKDLRELIGPVAYYGGFMPPAVPVWRFRRID